MKTQYKTASGKYVGLHAQIPTKEDRRLFEILCNQVILPDGSVNPKFHLVKSDNVTWLVHTQTNYFIGHWGFNQTRGLPDNECDWVVKHQYSYMKNTTFCNVYYKGKFQNSQGEYKGRPYNAKV